MDSASASRQITDLIAGHAVSWERDGRIPDAVLSRLSDLGLLCPEIPEEYGGLGMTSEEAGELLAHTGSLCSATRSVMTSLGIAAQLIRLYGSPDQRTTYLPQLAAGLIVGVAFTEPQAGSDLSAIDTRIVPDGHDYVVTGSKRWVTAADYAEDIVVIGRGADGGAAIAIVPTSAPGVTLEPVEDPSGIRAGGHAHVQLDHVVVSGEQVLADTGMPVTSVATETLTHGRITVAWGCVGIMRLVLRQAVRHAEYREQSGVALIQHQLIARRLGAMYLDERAATQLCLAASRAWDTGDEYYLEAAIAAKRFAASAAVRCADNAHTILASAAAHEYSLVAMAERTARLMRDIEGADDVLDLELADHARELWL
jgi:methoxymalonate biosynthesis protein